MDRYNGRREKGGVRVLVLWGIFIVSLILACIIGILLFVEIKSGRMPENVGLTIVVICYLNIFAVIVFGVILATINILRFFHLI